MTMSVRRHPAVGPTGATGATGSTGLTGATGATGPAGPAPAGVPVLHGPLVWDFTLTPLDGNVVALLGLHAADVLLALWAGDRTFIDPDQGTIDVGTPGNPTLFWQNTTPSDPPDDSFTPILQISVPYLVPADVTLQIRYNSSSGDLVPCSQGHMDIYALVARATAP